ncbi:hypothetical protein [Burkholderia anthina]
MNREGLRGAAKPVDARVDVMSTARRMLGHPGLEPLMPNACALLNGACR